MIKCFIHAHTDRVNHNQMAINYQNPVTHVYFKKSGWQGHFYVTKSSIQLGSCCASKKKLDRNRLFFNYAI